MKRIKKNFRILILILNSLFLAAILAIWGINSYIINFSSKYTMTATEASLLKNVDCIMVLGCGVRGDMPSPLLADRLQRGVEVYQLGASPKLLMSGDHGQNDYDEVNVMKQYALEAGISETDIFMDHAGFSTYETVYRAKEIFEADKVIIITQEYHLYRALYIAEQLGLEAYGVSADLNRYAGQSMRDFREVLARCKDWAMCIIKPEPTYLGEAIPVSGNGDLTND